MCMCEKCNMICVTFVLSLGILFLLQDLNIWDFWGVSWYTAVFLLIGTACLGKSCCKECKISSKKR